MPYDKDLTQPPLKRARMGAFGVFTIVGSLTAVWLVNIPDIQERTGTSHAVLGGLILLLGLGALVSMQFAGLLIRKFGSRNSVLLGLVLLVLTVNLPGLATDAFSLGVALFVFGLGHGITDVAMNHHAVVVERSYGRPIMSAFHAFYSLGGALGAVAAAGAQTLEVGLQEILLSAGILGAVGAAISVPALLGVRNEVKLDTAGHGSEDTSGTAPAPKKARRGQVATLAVLAFLILLSEGAANDWSALQTVEHLKQPESAAALAYGAFASAMTIGRLLADKVSHAAGPVHVVRYGSLMAAAGMLAVVLSSSYPLSILGWVLFGLGLSGIIPQIYTAAGVAGHSDAGKTLSRVVSSGYVGLLAGPALIGWLGSLMGLTAAFVVPLLFCAVGLVLAKAVAAEAETTDQKPVPALLSDGDR
ncbi:MFS transporter [Arthrobacter sp. SLBN-112]|uniref:MFS transporter n=1 Tax=Arthrobacter sp. SLBN-112 TaxID=2768452 RepID=UPI0027B10DB9|nr:MFS transporter [Arthrobacter sp. SLBN-112]MDQ0801472.1 MFS family permease [Arthrobacter sp. SLBN-112]